MKKVIYLLLFMPFIFSSCSTVEVDLRDDYVGIWSSNATGSMSILYNGGVMFTIPTEDSGNIHVSKSGTDELSIGSVYAALSGTKLLIDTETETQTNEGVTMQLTTTYKGTAAKGLMTITGTYSGNWSNSNGATGLISGSTTYTYTKK